MARAADAAASSSASSTAVPHPRTSGSGRTKLSARHAGSHRRDPNLTVVEGKRLRYIQSQRMAGGRAGGRTRSRRRRLATRTFLRGISATCRRRTPGRAASRTCVSSREFRRGRLRARPAQDRDPAAARRLDDGDGSGLRSSIPEPEFFSSMTNEITRRQLPCRITRTTADHRIIRAEFGIELFRRLFRRDIRARSALLCIDGRQSDAPFRRSRQPPDLYEPEGMDPPSSSEIAFNLAAQRRRRCSRGDDPPSSSAPRSASGLCDGVRAISTRAARSDAGGAPARGLVPGRTVNGTTGRAAAGRGCGKSTPRKAGGPGAQTDRAEIPTSDGGDDRAPNLIACSLRGRSFACRLRADKADERLRTAKGIALGCVGAGGRARASPSPGSLEQAEEPRSTPREVRPRRGVGRGHERSSGQPRRGSPLGLRARRASAVSPIAILARVWPRNLTRSPLTLCVGSRWTLNTPFISIAKRKTSPGQFDRVLPSRPQHAHLRGSPTK